MNVMFTDDKSMLVTVNTKDWPIERFNFILIGISKWFQANCLTLNPNETKVLKFAPTKLPSALNLAYENQFIPEVETINYLGSQLDSQISWKYHGYFFTQKI